MYNFSSFSANVAGQTLGADPLILHFGHGQAVLFQTRQMNRRSAFAARNQSFVLALPVVLRRTQTL